MKNAFYLILVLTAIVLLVSCRTRERPPTALPKSNGGTYYEGKINGYNIFVPSNIDSNTNENDLIVHKDGNTLSIEYLQFPEDSSDEE